MRNCIPDARAGAGGAPSASPSLRRSNCAPAVMRQGTVSDGTCHARFLGLLLEDTCKNSRNPRPKDSIDWRSSMVSVCTLYAVTSRNGSVSSRLVGEWETSSRWCMAGHGRCVGLPLIQNGASWATGRLLLGTRSPSLQRKGGGLAPRRKKAPVDGTREKGGRRLEGGCCLRTVQRYEAKKALKRAGKSRTLVSLKRPLIS